MTMTDAPRDDCALSVAEQRDRTPWTPPGLTFEVGDRVQIHLSTECQFAYGSGIRHFPAMDGAAGVIEEGPGHACVGPAGHDDTHGYAVRFQPPVRFREALGMSRTIISHCFAGCELQPISGEAR